MGFHRMFAGELDGELVLGHMNVRARAVRLSIGRLFCERDDNVYDPAVQARSWKLARQAGWCVVPVVIHKARPKPHAAPRAVPWSRSEPPWQPPA